MARRTCRRLRGFPEENGQAPLGIEEVDLEPGGCHGLPGTSSGRREGREMRRRSSEVDFCGRRPAESLMRTEVRVVDETQLDLPSEILGR
jgi:hypothetical protein